MVKSPLTSSGCPTEHMLKGVLIFALAWPLARVSSGLVCRQFDNSATVEVAIIADTKFCLSLLRKRTSILGPF